MLLLYSKSTLTVFRASRTLYVFGLRRRRIQTAARQKQPSSSDSGTIVAVRMSAADPPPLAVSAPKLPSLSVEPGDVWAFDWAAGGGENVEVGGGGVTSGTGGYTTIQRTVVLKAKDASVTLRAMSKS